MLRQSCLLPVFLSVFLISELTSASPLDVTPMPVIPQPIPIGEGTVGSQILFQVHNNTANTLILDYALAVITHGGPDTDDFINFSGAGGSNGLTSAPLFIGPQGFGIFQYSVDSPADAETPPVDNGVDPISFSIEMSPLPCNPANLPAPNNISSQIGFVAVLSPCAGFSGSPTAAVLAQLQLFQNPCVAPACNPAAPPQANLLYQNVGALLGISTVTGTAPTISTVTVIDTPEPSAWLTGITGLLILVLWSRFSSARA
jgi:hypothetical protein